VRAPARVASATTPVPTSPAKTAAKTKPKCKT
jgi:hypothetical protein